MKKIISISGFKFFLFFSVLVFFNIFFSSSISSAQNVELEVSGLRSAKGSVIVGVFKDHESYKKEIPFKSFKFNKNNISNGSLTLNLELEEGIYGITFLDDENDNGKMDYNYIGIPKEGFGFSDFIHKGVVKPHFDNFKQKVIKNQTNKFHIQVKYM